jgi:hypothetical protein
MESSLGQGLRTAESLTSLQTKPLNGDFGAFHSLTPSLHLGNNGGGDIQIAYRDPDLFVCPVVR